jgi:predicted DCC family thiol-disulfide oxidoreductase YuxK
MNWLINLASSSALAKVNDIDEEANKLAIVRVLLGFFMMFRVFQLLNASQFYFDTPDAFNLGIWFLGLTFLFTIGFLTPLVTLIILFYWHRLDTAMNAFTLGSSILMLLITVYLFTNIGGLRYSVDGYLMKKKGSLTSFVKKLYGVLGTPSKDKIHTIYFMGLFTYSLISLGAIIWHFQDPSWVGGTSVIELMGNSFLSKYYDVLRNIHMAFPVLFFYYSVFSIIGQSVFQLLAIPLIFTKYGITYVKLWGLGFFLASLFIIQLGYLPHIELLLWFLIFYRKKPETSVSVIYDDYCNLCKKSVTFFKKINWNKAYEFIPLSTNMNLLEDKGLEREELQSEMHGFVHDKLYIGYDLYIRLCWSNPFLVWLWPIMILGKYTKVGPLVYGQIAKNRHKYFGTCEVAFNVNKEIKKNFWPKPQNDKLFKGSMILVLGIYILYVIFQYPFIQQNTIKYYQAKNKIETYSKVIKWLNRTPFVMPLVFNKTDLMMGDRWAVIYRLKDGQKELVPITNLDGSRANYEGFDWFYYSNHGSDLLYFGNTVKYRRALIGQDVKAFHKQGTYGFSLLANRIKYDYRKTKQEGIVTYVVEVYESRNSADFSNPSFGQELVLNYNLNIQL